MRRPVVAVVVAVVILAAATAGGLVITACGGSTDAAATQAAAFAPPDGGRMPDMSALITQALDPLVEAGAITGDQEDAVVAALRSSGPGGGGQAPGDQPPSPGAQPSPGAAPMGDGGQAGTPPDPGRLFSSALGALVDDGTISTRQEAAISEALSSVMQLGGPGGQGATQTQTGSAGSSSTTQTY